MTDQEREKKVEAFINLSDIPAPNIKNNMPLDDFKKEQTKPVYLRAPETLWKEIHEIMARTGLSMNAICLELLRPEIKRKLKELRDN